MPRAVSLRDYNHKDFIHSTIKLKLFFICLHNAEFLFSYLLAVEEGEEEKVIEREVSEKNADFYNMLEIGFKIEIEQSWACVYKNAINIILTKV